MRLIDTFLPTRQQPSYTQSSSSISVRHETSKEKADSGQKKCHLETNAGDIGSRDATFR
tara:strand:+ start:31382 stop:31558 length:177 start_codon:yes stop_codon:yes gene_type:complete